MIPSLADEFFVGMRYTAPAAQEFTVVRAGEFYRFSIQYSNFDRDPPSQPTFGEIELNNGFSYEDAVAASLPRTNMVINGDAVASNILVPINYSTALPVADWLAQFLQMENPPFTFNQFQNSAAIGGFAAALQQCEDYMWNVWTDSAFDALNADLQAFVSSGAGAATVMDNSVLQPATTTAQNISPTTTRGGVRLNYRADSATQTTEQQAYTTPSAPGQTETTGNVLVTISTTGSGVQNVINVVDAVPVSEGGTPTSIDYQYIANYLTLTYGPVSN